MNRGTMIVVWAVLIASCGVPDGPGGPDLSETEPSDTSSTEAAPVIASTLPSPTSALPKSPRTAPTIVPAEPGPIDTGLRPLIDMAISDLAERLGVTANAIVPVSGDIVVWPDASLGCGDETFTYSQVSSEGTIILLDLDGVIYRYHSGGDVPPFLCDRPG